MHRFPCASVFRGFKIQLFFSWWNLLRNVWCREAFFHVGASIEMGRGCASAKRLGGNLDEEEVAGAAEREAVDGCFDEGDFQSGDGCFADVLGGDAEVCVVVAVPLGDSADGDSCDAGDDGGGGVGAGDADEDRAIEATKSVIGWSSRVGVLVEIFWLGSLRRLYP